MSENFMTNDMYEMARVSCEEIYETADAQYEWEAYRGNMDEQAKINCSTINTNCTCLQGYITATREQLEACLGPIMEEWDDKVCGQWILEHDGVVATVYCWKEDSIPAHKYAWHIGGHNPRALDLVSRLTGMHAFKAA